MNSTRQVAAAGKGGGDVYRAFVRLDRERRRRVAVRILQNQRLLADLYDHLLIRQALEERSRSVSWDSYRRPTRPTGR